MRTYTENLFDLFQCVNGYLICVCGKYVSWKNLHFPTRFCSTKIQERTHLFRVTHPQPLCQGKNKDERKPICFYI